jgi:Carboxypeptidase regulatory-like domain
MLCVGWRREDNRSMTRIVFASTVSAVVVIAFAALSARSADIVGQVRGQGSVSVAGLQLSVVNQAGVQIAVTTSDASGNYSFHDIAPGTYSFNLYGQSAVAYVPRDGLTVNWGVAKNFPPVALAKQGVAISSATGPAAK